MIYNTKKLAVVVFFFVAISCFAGGNRDRDCAVKSDLKTTVINHNTVAKELDDLLPEVGDEGVLCIVYERKSPRGHGLLDVKWDQRVVYEIDVVRQNKGVSSKTDSAGKPLRMTHEYVEERTPIVGSWSLSYESFLPIPDDLTLVQLVQYTFQWLQRNGHSPEILVARHQIE